MDSLVIASFLSLVANRIVEAVVQPLKIKFPELDFWWLIYVTWLVGGLLGYAAGVNLFAEYLPDELIGRTFTAIVIGGGSNLIADTFGNK
jgi:uncharacterized BrkB/YihY/UPF0761 family membrane protein